jgi:hypothetical protein
LQCDGKRSGTFEGDLIGPGFASAELALDDRLSFYVDRFGGEPVDFNELVRGLRIDGRIGVVAVAHADPAGGFLSDTVHACEPYGLSESGPPATAPPTT